MSEMKITGIDLAKTNVYLFSINAYGKPTGKIKLSRSNQHESDTNPFKWSKEGEPDEICLRPYIVSQLTGKVVGPSQTTLLPGAYGHPTIGCEARPLSVHSQKLSQPGHAVLCRLIIHIADVNYPKWLVSGSK